MGIRRDRGSRRIDTTLTSRGYQKFMHRFLIGWDVLDCVDSEGGICDVYQLDFLCLIIQ